MRNIKDLLIKTEVELISFYPASSIRNASVLKKGHLFEFHINFASSTWTLSRSEKFVRKNNLWKGNCCELFLGFENYYLEYHFSPCGGWNMFTLDRYRGELTPFKGKTPKIVWEVSDSFKLKVDLLEIADELRDWNAAIVEEVEQKTQNKNFWAINHGEKPDFHLRSLWLKNTKI